MAAIERMSTATLEDAARALLADTSGRVIESDIEEYTRALESRGTDAARDAIARIEAAR